MEANFCSRKKAALGRRLSNFTPREMYSVSEREVDSSRQDQIVFLCGRRRVGNINIVELVLPAQPLADFRHRTEVELSTILAGIRARQIRIEIELLCDHRGLPSLLGKFFAQCQGGKFVGHAVRGKSWG